MDHFGETVHHMRTAVFSSEDGSPVTESKDMWDHGQLRTGMSRSSPVAALDDTLHLAQVWQA